MSRHLLLLTLLITVAVFVRSPAEASLADETLLVKFSPAVDDQAARRILALQELRVVRQIPRLNVWVVAPLAGDRQTARIALETNQADLMWVEPNGVVKAAAGAKLWPAAATLEPDDNFYTAAQGNLQLIGMPEAWSMSRGDDAPLAVLDSGVDLDHPDLANKLWRNEGEIADNGLDDDGNGYIDDIHGWDFVFNDATPQDDNGHGSHVAGIAGAQTNNGIGIAGVAWESPLLPVKVLNRALTGSWDVVAAGIVYAVDQGARVLNLSLGGVESSLTIEAAVRYAAANGALVVTAAGNGGGDILYPAALPDTLAVAATDSADRPWTYSNRGPQIDLAAPGVNIFSTDNSGSYYSGYGTSAATPHVSGVAALIWAVQPALSARQVQAILENTAKDVYVAGEDNATGHGRLDAAAAVRRAFAPPVYLPLVRLP